MKQPLRCSIKRLIGLNFIAESTDMKIKRKLQVQFKALFEKTDLLNPEAKLSKEEDKVTGAIMRILIQMGHKNYYTKFDVTELYDEMLHFAKGVWTDKKMTNKDGEEEDLMDKILLVFIAIHFKELARKKDLKK